MSRTAFQKHKDFMLRVGSFLLFPLHGETNGAMTGLTFPAGPVAALCCLGREGMAAQSITELFQHLVILHMQGRGVGHL